VIDTSSRTEGVALAHGDWAVSVTACRTRRGHSLLLLPTIERMLEQQGWTVDQIEGLGVVVGPGSFTGVRVGIATIDGLARATGAPAFAYSSLRVRAMAMGGGGAVAPILDARKGEVYGALYEGQRALLEPCAAAPDEFAERLAAAAPEGPLLACGGGARLYRERLAQRLGARLSIAGGAADTPGVAAMAVDVAARVAAGEQPRDGELAPVYLRASQAEGG